MERCVVGVTAMRKRSKIRSVYLRLPESATRMQRILVPKLR